MSFHQFNLDARLMRGIERAGYSAPTPIQKDAIPAALAGHDLIGTAQTGTGKTAAFVLPMLHRLLVTKDALPLLKEAGERERPRRRGRGKSRGQQSRGRSRARALIVTPTRELAEQINQTIRELASGTGLRSVTIYGGVGARPQIDALRDNADILVACPGRLLDHIDSGHADLGDLDTLVLDEADRMLDMGFMPDVRRIIKKVPDSRQTMLFSATFPPEIESLAAETLEKPKRITLGLSRPVHTVAHALYPVIQTQKTELMLALLRDTDTESVLIFTRTKHRAKRLAEKIGKTGRTVTSLHSNRSQNQRQEALNGFKKGTYQIMVATDIAARGLDVDSVSHVINYDMPDTPDAYIHRIGRTGRAQRTGDAFTFLAPEDEPIVRLLEKIMGQRLKRLVLAGFNYVTTPSTVPPPAPGKTRHGRSRQNSGPKSNTQRRSDTRKTSGSAQSRHRQSERETISTPGELTKSRSRNGRGGYSRGRTSR